MEKQNQGGPNGLMGGRAESGSFYAGDQMASQGEKHGALLEGLEGFLHIKKRRAVPGKERASTGKEDGMFLDQ